MECKCCQTELTPDNTYRRTGKKSAFPVGYYRVCKQCYNIERNARVKIKKRNIIDAMGGQCHCCGYDVHTGALELHHRDPSKKDPKTTKHLRHITDVKRIQQELAKCVLLCANCHRETHAGLHPEYMDLW